MAAELKLGFVQILKTKGNSMSWRLFSTTIVLGIMVRVCVTLYTESKLFVLFCVSLYFWTPRIVIKVTSIIFVFIYDHLVIVGKRKLLRIKKSCRAKGREQQMLTKYQKFLDVVVDMLAGQKKQLQWRSMHIFVKVTNDYCFIDLHCYVVMSDHIMEPTS